MVDQLPKEVHVPAEVAPLGGVQGHAQNGRGRIKAAQGRPQLDRVLQPPLAPGNPGLVLQKGP